MKNKLLSLDATLIALWVALLVNSLSKENELHFGLPMSAHLSILAFLIIGRMIFKKVYAVRAASN